ncbi:MAG: hypothetical protein HQM08_19455 [Candidatus Riflebacteria bacterium]|nr:hypothetical protein [Candidatus Riflebacteria bacterium]
MVCRRLPQSIANLREIDVIGEATCTKYGRDILSNVTAFMASEKVEKPSSSSDVTTLNPGVQMSPSLPLT